MNKASTLINIRGHREFKPDRDNASILKGFNISPYASASFVGETGASMPWYEVAHHSKDGNSALGDDFCSTVQACILQ